MPNIRALNNLLSILLGQEAQNMNLRDDKETPLVPELNCKTSPLFQPI